MNLPTLNAIGCGRVGQTLARLWQVQGVCQIQDILGTSGIRTQAASQWIGAGRPVAQLAAMRPATFWMLAVPDAQIAGVAQHLGVHCKALEPATAFHCSGALDATVLEPLASLGWQVASAHCILSFASPAIALKQFAGSACALEGSPAACTALRAVFTSIGAQCFDVARADKLLYHAAAVFATNFLPVLQATAEDLWRHTGVPAALIPALRASLLRHAVDNITTQGPQGALTGPAARGDLAAIARQAQAVDQFDEATGAAYQALSTLALRLAQRSA